MFAQTHTNFNPWIIVQANNKRVARLENALHTFQFDSKTRREQGNGTPDPNIISRYFRDLEQIDI